MPYAEKEEENSGDGNQHPRVLMRSAQTVLSVKDWRFPEGGLRSTVCRKKSTKSTALRKSLEKNNLGCFLERAEIAEPLD